MWEGRDSVKAQEIGRFHEGMATSEMEQLEAEVRAALYSLAEEELKRVYEELKLGDIKGKTRRQIITDINRHLDSLNMESEKDDSWATLQMIKTNFLATTTKPIPVKPISSTNTVNPNPPESTSANTSPSMAEVTEVLAAAMNRKEFRIHGQIGQPGQGDKLSFPSLARRIEEGKRKGYPDEEHCGSPSSGQQAMGWRYVDTWTAAGTSLYQPFARSFGLTIRRKMLSPLTRN